MMVARFNALAQRKLAHAGKLIELRDQPEQRSWHDCTTWGTNEGIPV